MPTVSTTHQRDVESFTCVPLVVAVEGAVYKDARRRYAAKRLPIANDDGSVSRERAETGPVGRPSGVAGDGPVRTPGRGRCAATVLDDAGDVARQPLDGRVEPHQRAGADERQEHHTQVFDRCLSALHAGDSRAADLTRACRRVTHSPQRCYGASSDPTEPAAVRASAVMTGNMAAGTRTNTTTSSTRGAALAARSCTSRA